MSLRLRHDIFLKINREREKQERKHGENSILKQDPFSFMNIGILGEEFGEVARALQDVYWCHQGDLNSFQEEEHLKDELIQVVAVAVAWLEALEKTE